MKKHKHKALHQIYGKLKRDKLFLTLYACLAISVFLVHSTLASPASQTHTITTSEFNWGLDNGQTVSFSASSIDLGDSNGLWSWIDSDTVRFYNLKMGASQCPTSWSIAVSNANVTITKLFEDQELRLTVNGASGTTSTTEVYVGDWDKPVSVDGVDSWSYDFNTKIVTFQVTHASSQDVTFSWVAYEEWLPPPVTGEVDGTEIPFDIARFLQFLFEGDFFGFVQGTYVMAFQSSNVFYTVIILLFTVPLYIRTKSLMFMCILYILIAGLILAAFPIISGTAILLLVFGLAGMLYKIYMRIRGGG